MNNINYVKNHSKTNFFKVYIDGEKYGRFFGSNHKEAADKAFTSRFCGSGKEGIHNINIEKIVLECIRNGEKDSKFFKVHFSPSTEETPCGHSFLTEIDPKTDESKVK